MMNSTTLKTTESLPAYVSLIDDPRISMEMVDQFIAVQLEYWEEGEKEFLESLFSQIQLTETSETILFPVLDVHALYCRLKELASWTYGKSYSFFSSLDVAKVAFKIASKKFEHRIGYSDKASGDYGNSELQMFVHTYESIMINGSCSLHYLEDAIGLEDSDFSITSGCPVMIMKMQCFLSAILYTATNNGRNTHKDAMKNSDRIKDEVSMERHKGITLKRLLSLKNNATITLNNETLANGEFVKVTNLFFNLGSIFLEKDHDADVIFSLEQFNVTSGMLRYAKMINNDSFKINYNDQLLTVNMFNA